MILRFIYKKQTTLFFLIQNQICLNFTCFLLTISFKASHSSNTEYSTDCVNVTFRGIRDSQVKLDFQAREVWENQDPK